METDLSNVDPPLRSAQATQTCTSKPHRWLSNHVTRVRTGASADSDVSLVHSYQSCHGHLVLLLDVHDM